MPHPTPDTLHARQDGGLPGCRPMRVGWLRSLQILAALALATATAATGCSSTAPTPPPFCKGGFVRTVKGVKTCEGLCAPSKCQNPGNVCVDNLCALPCQADTDCAMGESCLPATIDGNGGTGGGTATATCQNNGRSAIGSKCPNGNECASKPSCPDGSNCDYTQCGGGTCSPDPVACGSSTTCAIGKCADATPCTVQGCAQTECAPLVCLSAGVGDADAYCTLKDCAGDASCPGGYFCAAVRDPHPLCGAPASKIPGLCGVPCGGNVTCTNAYGKGATCANTDSAGNGYCEAACVMAGTGTYTQGPYCAERKECRIRKPCDPCAADLDCSATPGMHCTAMGSASFCASDCGTDTDCAADFKCTSGECVPRGGSCTGNKAFCEPCHDDSECKAGDYCSGSDGHICVAPIGTIACTTDTDCPTAPSGLHGKCMDATTESQPGDGVYHTCWLPFFQSIDAFQCWANNTGAACGVGSDCVSKICLSADPTTGTLGKCM